MGLEELSRREFLRIAGLIATSAVLDQVLTACSAISPPTATPVKGELLPPTEYRGWTQYQGGPERTGFYPVGLDLENARIQQFHIANAVDLGNGVYPDAKGFLFMPDNALITDNTESWGRIFGFDLGNTRVAWEMEDHSVIPPYVGNFAPIIDKRGNLIIRSKSTYNTASISSDKKIAWAQSNYPWEVWSHLTYEKEKDVVLFAVRSTGRDRQKPILICLDARDGKVLWENKSDQWQSVSSPTIDKQRGEVYLLTQKSMPEILVLTAYDLHTGQEKWQSSKIEGNGSMNRNIVVTSEGIVCPTDRGISLVDRDSHQLKFSAIRDFGWMSDTGSCAGKGVCIFDNLNETVALSLENGKVMWEKTHPIFVGAIPRNRVMIGDKTYYAISKVPGDGGGVDLFVQDIHDGKIVKQLSLVVKGINAGRGMLGFQVDGDKGRLFHSSYNGYLSILDAPLTP